MDIVQAIDPTSGQALAEIEAYLRGVEIGAEVAIRNTQYGILAFVIAKVTEIKPRAGRLYTDRLCVTGGNSWYAKTGKSALFPTGQSRLFVPTEAVRAFVDKNPNGLPTHNIYIPA